MAAVVRFRLSTDFRWLPCSCVGAWLGDAGASRAAFPRRAWERSITALRYAPGSFAPSAFQGHAAKGRPWPIAALGFGILRRSISCIHAVVAASLPLNPFHTDSAHPSDGTVSPCKQVVFVISRWLSKRGRWFGWRSVPHQKAERRCRAEGHLAWMPNEERWAMDGPSRRPSERCRSEGSRAQRDPDAGVCFFASFLCTSKEREAPGGAQ